MTCLRLCSFYRLVSPLLTVLLVGGWGRLMMLFTKTVLLMKLVYMMWDYFGGPSTYSFN